jgi:hypothetical protein
MSVQLQPSTRLQLFLSNCKTSLVLLREVLLEFKEVLVAATMILFFLLGVATAIYKLYGAELHKIFGL